MSMDNEILVVDDDISNLKLLTELLEKEGYRVRPVEKAHVALDSAVTKPPGLILLDVRMPEMDGFELCRRLKQDERTQHVPLIFISALNDNEAQLQGFDAGGIDFISKPFEEQEVLARVKTHMQLHTFQQNLEQLLKERTTAAIESETRFSYIVANANEAIVVTQDEAVKYCNPKISDLTGYSPEDVYSLSLDKFIHPEDLEMVLGEYRSRLSGEKPKSSYSTRLIMRDGQERQVVVNSALIEWE
ncbi:MAG: response regulator, partial [Desulfobulbia bacterium]